MPSVYLLNSERWRQVKMNVRHYKIATISILLLLGLLWGATSDRLKIDGLSGEIWDLIFTTDTKYANGYSDNRFNQIKIGMTEEEVLGILGAPLTRWSPYHYTRFQNKANFVGFQYSECPSDTHYRLRQIYFDNGIVAERIGYFYID